MAKLDFSYPESKEVWNHLETASVRSHHNPRRAFDDFLTMSVCSLSGGQMEEEYMKTIQPYTDGDQGKRAIDEFPKAFAVLVNAMEETRKDILGDIFMGGVTFGQNGQFFTPDHVCDLMAEMSMSEDTTGKRVYDSACGSGRTLLAAARINRNNEFYGQDVDIRCVQMTTLNLALWNLYGTVIHGNSLADERHLMYRTGFNGKGVIESVDVSELPPVIKETPCIPPVDRPMEMDNQLVLF